MIGNNKAARGFTLVEILIVIGIFVVLTAVIADVVLLSAKSQRQTADRQTALTNLRYVSEVISRHVRTADIDYAVLSSNDLSSAVNLLPLKDYNGNVYKYYRQNGAIILETNGFGVALTDPKAYLVRQVDFYISPATNPFSQERCDQALQPNGCLNATISCTANSTGLPTNQIVPLGYCQCSNDTDCATGRCDNVSGVCLPIDRQPLVTMVITLETVSAKESERQLITLQTSISSRIYKR